MEDDEYDRRRLRTPDQCREYHEEMAGFHMACASRLIFDLSLLTKTYGHTEQELLELKKFLVLKATKRDIGNIPLLCPSIKIEEMWVDFLKHPVLYHRFCRDLVDIRDDHNKDFKYSMAEYNIIDHVPLDEPCNSYASFNNTMREYSKFFDYNASGELWRNPFPQRNLSPPIQHTSVASHTPVAPHPQVAPHTPVAQHTPVASHTQVAPHTKDYGNSSSSGYTTGPNGTMVPRSSLKKTTIDDDVVILSDSAKKRRFGYLPEDEEKEEILLRKSPVLNQKKSPVQNAIKSENKAQGGGKRRGPGRPPSSNPKRPKTKKPSDKPLSERLHSERGPDGRFTSVAAQPKN